MLTAQTITENFKQVQNRIAEAAKVSGRTYLDIDLVAVCKTHDITKILPLLKIGHATFGENKVQEAEKKWPTLKKMFPDTKLHLIGPLQSNKVKRAVSLFDVIETIDREKTAKKVAQEIKSQGRNVKCYIQINTGEETNKSGLAPLEIEPFLKKCANEISLQISGLMCIPPIREDAGSHFSLLSDLASRNNIPLLSMGMSRDYELAIKCGSTGVRVGTSIFGTRSSFRAERS